MEVDFDFLSQLWQQCGTLISEALRRGVTSCVNELAILSQPEEKSGVFFAQSVFGILGTFLVSPKIRSFVVSETSRKIKELLGEIRKEIISIQNYRTADDSLRDVVENSFNNRLKKVKNQLKWIKFLTCLIQFFTWATILGGLGSAVHVLHAKTADKYGVCLLGVFALFPIIRFFNKILHKRVDACYRQERKAFSREQEASQSIYRREILSASHEFRRRISRREAS